MHFNIEHITSLFENATEGIIVTDHMGRIILVNPSACHMFGYEPEELIDEKIEILIPSQYRQGHVKYRDAFYADPKNRVMGHGRDLHGRKQMGENFPVEVSLSTYVQNGERYIIAFIIDITLRKEGELSILSQKHMLEKMTQDMKTLNAELEAKVEERTAILKEALLRLEQSQEELNEVLDKERQLNEIKSRFVSMASHEFRTPLSTVLSSASLLGKYGKTEDQEKRSRHINKIKDSVKHLNDLLEDFLSMGKLDEGKLVVELNAFNIREMIEETIDEIKVMAKPEQHIIYQHVGSENIECGKKLVMNICINLISNAIKFSSETKPIHVDSEVNANSVTISVRDEGIGIADEDLPHLFSSFFRGKNAVNIQGTGLGLHIVKRYLDLLNGKILVESAIGEGTVIKFIVPVKCI